jgi:hypothetical protein
VPELLLLPWDLSVPRRVAKAGITLAMSGFNAGVDAHTIAKLISMADQYAVAEPYQVASCGLRETIIKALSRRTETIQTLALL